MDKRGSPLLAPAVAAAVVLVLAAICAIFYFRRRRLSDDSDDSLSQPQPAAVEAKSEITRQLAGFKKHISMSFGGVKSSPPPVYMEVEGRQQSVGDERHAGHFVGEMMGDMDHRVELPAAVDGNSEAVVHEASAGDGVHEGSAARREATGGTLAGNGGGSHVLSWMNYEGR